MIKTFIRRIRILFLFFTFLISSSALFASYLFIPMDLTQANHLKAYGIAFYSIERGIDVSWLLNYRGGSFMMIYDSRIEDECLIRGVTCDVIADVQMQGILHEISASDSNMDEIRLTKVPKIAVYSPKQTSWDDAVTLALTYAEIPTMLYTTRKY